MRPAVWVFSSQGGQWPGMARVMLAEEPVFAEAIGRCEAEISPRLGWSLTTELRREDGQARVHNDDRCVQPALTAVQIALACLMRSRGLEPVAVAGLSMGEVAAANVAGALDLRDAMAVVCCQAALTERELRPGKMAYVELSTEQVAEALSGSGSEVSVACELSPSTTVLAGAAQAVDAATDRLLERGVRVGVVPVRFAFHTRQVAGLETEFRASLGELRAQPGIFPFYSSAVGGIERGEALGAAHWWRIMSEPSRFTKMIRALAHDGIRTFVEIGPHPVLVEPITSTLRREGVEATVLASGRRGDGRSTFDAMVAELASHESLEHNQERRR